MDGSLKDKIVLKSASEHYTDIRFITSRNIEFKFIRNVFHVFTSLLLGNDESLKNDSFYYKKDLEDTFL